MNKTTGTNTPPGLDVTPLALFLQMSRNQRNTGENKGKQELQFSVSGVTLHALSGRACNFLVAGLMYIQNVTTPRSTHTMLVM